MMRILTPENRTFSMNDVPDQVEDIRYCVLDYSNTDAVDYHWLPLIFLEIFSAPPLDLMIGPYRIQMPLDWSIVIGEKDFGEIEIISLQHLNDRNEDFSAFCFNPIRGYMPEFLDIEIINVFPDVKWYVPKLKYGHILAVPLTDRAEPIKDKRRRDPETPQVAYLCRDVNRLPDTLDIRKLI